ncbi:bacillithiol system redox-active protein YtxJ [Muriicola sp. Z0-33]|uniref:bacillithiol system redox-active protein YtxJ n=1 Tax=Muriicola sp. Z0-33 TaxID=2816957 RepID=UPI002237865D|nr:bacillithiol system redox-active protein YtxJ [Muriicola sp. Z0-33]MCW5516561.1 bacillithiol system redox-active protein YtxJ [Muriicola sp. Z0-33]
MGIFSSIFGNSSSGENNDNGKAAWISLNSLDQLEEIEKMSEDRPQFIFKHSTSCGISGMVLRMFKQSYSLEPKAADLYYLDLHAYRQISNKVAEKFGVYHQSPQLLVIKNGEVVAHNSHGGISEMALENYI